MNDCPPAPIVDADVDCTDLDGFMLNAERLMASELVALSSHEVIGAALLLWCRAWKQRPAASLPDDEKVMAAFARMPLVRFRKVRDEVLRGFVLCSDGRLYHRTLAAEAIKAYGRKVTFQQKRHSDAERLRNWREAQKEAVSTTKRETQHETRFVAEGQGRDRDGTGKGQKEKKKTTLGVAELVSMGVKRQHAEDWLRARKEKRQPLTATALQAVKDRAESAGMSLDDAVRHSAINGWAGFNPKWLTESGTADPGAVAAEAMRMMEARDAKA